MSGIKNPMVSAISSSAFPISGLSQATKQALKLFVPSPKTCYTDQSRKTRAVKDGSVGMIDELSQRLNSNLILNPTISGAVVGSPGSQPNAWSVQSLVSGINREIVGIGTENVLGTTMNYIDIKFSGTATSSGSLFLDPSPLMGASAKVGEQWCGSIYAKLAPSNTGGFSGIILSLMVPELSSSTAVLNTNAIQALQGMTTTYQRYAAQRVFTDASTAYTSLIIRTNTISVGTAINFTVRLAGPQLEKNVTSPTPFNYRTSAYQLTTGWQPKLRKGAKNWLLNSSFANVVVGTPGTGPTPNYGAASGITSSIVSKGTESYDGKIISYTDWRIYGTASTSGDCLFDQSVFGQIPASFGQNWTNSCLIKLIAGSIPVRTSSRGYVYLHERTSAGAVNKSTPSSSFDTVGSSYTRFVASGQVTVASSAYTTFGIRYGVSLGETIDFTIRVAAPQQELGTSVSEWVSTSGAPASSGVGQWWLDFDGVQTRMDFGSKLYSDTGVLNFSSVSAICNTYGNTQAILSSYGSSNQRSNSHYFNPALLSLYRDNDGVSRGYTHPIPTAPYQPIVSSLRRNDTQFRHSANGVVLTATGSLTDATLTNSTLGYQITGNFLNGGIYGVAVGDGVSPTDNEMISIDKYLGKLQGIII